MSESERWVSLDQAASFASGGTPSKANPDYWNGHIPWVSAKDMKSSRIFDAEDHITEIGVANGSRLAPAGATLVLVRGMTLLNDVPICLATRDVAFNQDVKALVAKDGVVDRYLNYAIHAAKPTLLSAVDLAGHGTGKLPTDIFKSIRIRLPDEDEQHATAHILGTLDDKIELNRRMNETLEAMARAIFKSWFVDFDPVRAKASGEPPESICRRLGLTPDVLALFPDSFQDSELGEIPVGWRVGSLFEHAKLLSGGTPKTARDDYWGGPIRWASAKDVSQCREAFLIDTERTITSIGLKESATQLIPALSTVIVSRGATTGRMVILGYEMAMNQTCYALASKTDSPSWLYCTLQERIASLVQSAHGSVFDTITTATFTNTLFLLPPPRCLEAIEATIGPILRRILAGAKEAAALSILRDTLLPRLLSGEMEYTRTTRFCELA